jgi:UPF0716 protein FxsA
MRFFVPFLLLPIIEIGLFVTLGAWLGLWVTLLIVILSAVLGIYLIRQQGLGALAKMRGARAGLADPLTFVASGLFVVVSGILLILPGFSTDTLGLILFLPPVRRAIIGALASRVVVGKPRQNTPDYSGRDASEDVIDAEYHEVSTPQKSFAPKQAPRKD